MQRLKCLEGVGAEGSELGGPVLDVKGLQEVEYAFSERREDDRGRAFSYTAGILTHRPLPRLLPGGAIQLPGGNLTR